MCRVLGCMFRVLEVLVRCCRVMKGNSMCWIWWCLRICSSVEGFICLWLEMSCSLLLLYSVEKIFWKVMLKFSGVNCRVCSFGMLLVMCNCYWV